MSKWAVLSMVTFLVALMATIAMMTITRVVSPHTIPPQPPPEYWVCDSGSCKVTFTKPDGTYYDSQVQCNQACTPGYKCKVSDTPFRGITTECEPGVGDDTFPQCCGSVGSSPADACHECLPINGACTNCSARVLAGKATCDVNKGCDCTQQGSDGCTDQEWANCQSTCQPYYSCDSNCETPYYFEVPPTGYYATPDICKTHCGPPPTDFCWKTANEDECKSGGDMKACTGYCEPSTGLTCSDGSTPIDLKACQANCGYGYCPNTKNTALFGSCYPAEAKCMMTPPCSEDGIAQVGCLYDAEMSSSTQAASVCIKDTGCRCTANCTQTMKCPGGGPQPPGCVGCTIDTTPPKYKNCSETFLPPKDPENAWNDNTCERTIVNQDYYVCPDGSECTLAGIEGAYNSMINNPNYKQYVHCLNDPNTKCQLASTVFGKGNIPCMVGNIIGS